MKQHIAHIALVVRDYDEAIQFYTQKLHFRLVEDTVLSATKRWVLVAPKGSNECCLLLAKAADPELGVVVEGADDVDYQNMINILDVLQQLDITKVGLATGK